MLNGVIPGMALRPNNPMRCAVGFLRLRGGLESFRLCMNIMLASLAESADARVSD